MLEDHLKICIFLNEKKEISLESIQQVSSELKQFNIFDLQNAIGLKDKSKSLTVANNLLDNGAEPTFIITMLTRYFTGLAKITELKTKNIPLQKRRELLAHIISIIQTMSRQEHFIQMKSLLKYFAPC
jgi:DNA polymerase III delta subunit